MPQQLLRFTVFSFFLFQLGCTTGKEESSFGKEQQIEQTEKKISQLRKSLMESLIGTISFEKKVKNKKEITSSHLHPLVIG